MNKKYRTKLEDMENRDQIVAATAQRNKFVV